jgi:hypothetical protein
LGDPNDMSAITYIACVAIKNASKNMPWALLKNKKQSTITKVIKNVIESYILPIAQINQLVVLKNNYNATVQKVDEFIVKSTSWDNFLPYFEKYDTSNISNITTKFKTTILYNLFKGLAVSRNDVDIINTKILLYSVGIQTKIQDVVIKNLKENGLLIKNKSNIPEQINACCVYNNNSTIEFFKEQNADIVKYISIINDLLETKNIIDQLTQPVYLFSEIKTKYLYGDISKLFSQETMYKLLINKCNLLNENNIPSQYSTLCPSKINDLIHENDEKKQIELVHNYYNLNKENFIQLQKITNKTNITHQTINTTYISQEQKISNIYNNEKNNDELRILNATHIMIMKKLYTLSDNVPVENIKTIITKLSNDLHANIKADKHKIELIIQSPSEFPLRTKKQASHMLNTIGVVLADKDITEINNNNMQQNYFMFLKNKIHDLGKIYPFMLHQVFYTYYGGKKTVSSNLKNTDPTPIHWGLSYYHDELVQRILNNKYRENIFFLFSSNDGIERSSDYILSDNIAGKLHSIIKQSKIIIDIIDQLQYNSNITSLYGNDLSLLLMEYYLIKIIMLYVDMDDHQNDPSRTNIIITFLKNMYSSKQVAHMSYHDLMEIQYKLVAKEKNNFTDRLKDMSKDIRRIDNEKRQIGQGIYAIGAQKDLRIYNKYTNDKNLRVSGLRKHENEMIEQLFNEDNEDNDDNDDNDDRQIGNVDYLRQEENDLENEALDLENQEFEIHDNDEDYDDGNIDD